MLVNKRPDLALKHADSFEYYLENRCNRKKIKNNVVILITLKNKSKETMMILIKKPILS